MTAADLIVKIREAGHRLWLEAGAVRFSKSIPADLREALARRIRTVARLLNEAPSLPGNPADDQDPARKYARAAEKQNAAIFSCDPSSNQHLPPGWENPENWS